MLSIQQFVQQLAIQQTIKPTNSRGLVVNGVRINGYGDQCNAFQQHTEKRQQKTQRHCVGYSRKAKNRLSLMGLPYAVVPYVSIINAT